MSLALNLSLALSPTGGAAGGGGGASYQYVFVECVTTGNGYIGCSTIKVLEEEGGTDFALQSAGATASARNYSVNGGFPITNVNDGNDATFTTSGANAHFPDHGIVIDLGQARSFAQVGYRSRSDEFGAAEAITSGFIKAKLNLEDEWTILATVTEAGWVSNEYRVLYP